MDRLEVKKVRKNLGLGWVRCMHPIGRSVELRPFHPKEQAATPPGATLIVFFEERYLTVKRPTTRINASQTSHAWPSYKFLIKIEREVNISSGRVEYKKRSI